VSGDGGPATAASFLVLSAIAVDSVGNLYIADADANTVRLVDATGTIRRIAGTGVARYDGDGAATSHSLAAPLRLAVLATEDVVIADNGNARLRRLYNDAGTWTLETIAGTGTSAYDPTQDGGLAAAAEIGPIKGLAVGADAAIYFADDAAVRIRRIDPSSHIVTTMLGKGDADSSGDGLPVAAASIGHINAIAVDGQGRLVFSDVGSRTVRRVDSDGLVRTIAGPLQVGDGPWSAARLTDPTQIAFMPDGSQLLVADGTGAQLRDVDVVNQQVHVMAGDPAGQALGTTEVDSLLSRLLAFPGGIAIADNGQTLYVAETLGHTILKLRHRSSGAETSWLIAVLAGKAGAPGFADGALSTAQFDMPRGLTYDDATRTLYVADAGNAVVRAVDVDAGDVRTIAGTPGVAGYFGEGVRAADVIMTYPTAVALAPSGGLYVADALDNRVRYLEPDDAGHASAASITTTVIGDGSASSSGTGSPAGFFAVKRPAALAVDRFGNLFIASADALREVSAGADGVARTDDAVLTIYGAPPRNTFPMVVTSCIADVVTDPGDAAGLWIADSCQGYLLHLQRQALPLGSTTP
jgi:DNA-binding beta-propeller fold protein YncE